MYRYGPQEDFYYNLANEYNNSGDTVRAIKYYQKAAKSYNTLVTQNVHMNLAKLFAIQNKKEEMFRHLFWLANNQFTAFDFLIKPEVFGKYYSDPRWPMIDEKIQVIKAKLNNQDPTKIQILTSDIDHFWEAYDKASLVPKEKRYAIYENLYFKKGTKGLHFYKSFKIRSLFQFVNSIARHEQYYTSIRKNTVEIANYQKEIIGYFQKFKQLYPPAKFPDIHFVMGNFTSGGTTSKIGGLMIGAEFWSKDSSSPVKELSNWEKNNVKNKQFMPIVVVHEIVHIQQQFNTESLLSYAILEGGADFICSLITGQNANPQIHQWVADQKNEKSIWEEFTKEMYGRDFSRWIANGDRAGNRPADLGYYVGYKICEAYYNRAINKSEAIREIIEVKDFSSFLAQSKYDGSSD